MVSTDAKESVAVRRPRPFHHLLRIRHRLLKQLLLPPIDILRVRHRTILHLLRKVVDRFLQVLVGVGQVLYVLRQRLVAVSSAEP